MRWRPVGIFLREMRKSASAEPGARLVTWARHRRRRARDLVTSSIGGRRSPRLVVAVAMAVSMLAGFGVARGADGPGVDLGITHFPYEVLVDDTNGHIFVSGGSTALDVFDLAGQPVTTIPMLGAAGMRLTDDGQTLYVAAADAGQIIPVDAGTLTAEAPIETGVSLTGRLAIAGGRVWFGVQDATDYCPNSVASIPVGGTTVQTYLGGSFPDTCVWFATTAARPDVLLIKEGHYGSVRFSVWDASTDPPTELVGAKSLDNVSFGNVFAPHNPSVISSDGNRLIAADANGIGFEFRMRDLAWTRRTYSHASGASAMAVTPVNGGFLAMAGLRLSYPPNTAVSTFQLGGSGGVVGSFVDADAIARVAFGSDGTLYALQWNSETGHVWLFVVSGAARFRSTLRLEMPNAVDFGQTTKLVAHVSEAAATGIATIEATEVDRPTVVLKSGPIDENGNLGVRTSFTRNVVIEVSYEGNDRFLPNHATTRLPVRFIVRGRLLRADGRAGKYHLYKYGHPVSFSVRVRPDQTGEPVRVVLARPHGNGWDVIISKRFRLRSGSTLLVGVTDLPVGRYRIFSFIYPDEYNSRGRSPWAYFEVA